MAADDRRRSLIDHFLLQHRRSGTPIGELDTPIAAHALAGGLTLVTHNMRHFGQVLGLQLEDWMEEPLAPAKTRRKRS